MTLSQQIAALLANTEHAILLPELTGPFWIQDCDPEVIGCEGVDVAGCDAAT
jgi:hypothetical protein